MTSFTVLLMYGLPMDECVGLSGVLGILIALYYTLKKEYEKHFWVNDDNDC